MKSITVIPARKTAKGVPLASQQKLRVAAYCRVSTDSDEQATSYDAQIKYYTELIENNPEWTLAGIFADEGISGTNTKKRDEFNRMIEECKVGNIDMVLTKSISRFARNTLDCLKYIRMLKEKGIAGLFPEREHQHAGRQGRGDDHHHGISCSAGIGIHQQECETGHRLPQ